MGPVTEKLRSGHTRAWSICAAFRASFTIIIISSSFHDGTYSIRSTSAD